MRRALTVAIVLLASAPATALAGGPPAVCEYIEAGVVGPVDNTLRVKTQSSIRDDDLTVRQTGAGEIEVVGNVSGEVPCSGPEEPTTTNLDSVVVKQRRLEFLEIRLRVLGPGATPEVDGTSELEIELRGGRTVSQVALLGDRTDESFDVSILDGRRTIDIDPVSAVVEEDVVLPQRAIFGLLGRGGADAVVVRGKEDRFALIDGGGGIDLLRGGGGPDVLVGGSGNDEIRGRGGRDVLIGATGRDLFDAGPGRDIVAVSRDDERDRGDCGPGRDRVFTDPQDQVVNCERDEGSSRRSTLRVRDFCATADQGDGLRRCENKPGRAGWSGRSVGRLFGP